MDGATEETIRLEVAEEEAGQRLDVFLADAIEDASRSFLSRLMKQQRVTLNGAPCRKAGTIVSAGDVVTLDMPPPPPDRPAPEDIPLDILYEDAHLIFVNKPSGLVVHPAPGNYTGTLVNALLHHAPNLAQASPDPQRPGIVHRLDRDTSGVMVVAKTPLAYQSLVQQASAHAFDRRYYALVRGDFRETSGRITAPIGRSPSDRTRMAVTGVRAREAITNFEVLENFGVAAHVALQLETGRTHQIRVHLRFASRPILGDPTYGITEMGGIPRAKDLRDALEGLQGQALHAGRLGVRHPESAEKITFEAPPPEDFQRLLDALRAYAAEDAG